MHAEFLMDQTVKKIFTQNLRLKAVVITLVMLNYNQDHFFYLNLLYLILYQTQHSYYFFPSCSSCCALIMLIFTFMSYFILNSMVIQYCSQSYLFSHYLFNKNYFSYFNCQKLHFKFEEDFLQNQIQHFAQNLISLMQFISQVIICIKYLSNQDFQLFYVGLQQAHFPSFLCRFQYTIFFYTSAVA
ncbi:transmembrane protein, putative (macronuclear) [Tetrahymena thermophila SB210]|uniref:Transmembrane protein, putative n=1 Tax=Tetrahymena thermophila (strain SB210) TaxID=312017 RepID=W7X627_TETTS|nr:transmembrane protein, putative [Tetrahymena thermophila SB210]EWS71788.1 transmembrane protein, putative [Tetrahymena thermophila SB210]|eukprot:XP_012655675.1 transmembrane protein, putative [Tetrahymena thermophila SB210]